MGPTTITPRPKPRSSSFTSNHFRQRIDGVRVIEPATEQVLAELQEATVEDADMAVARAKAAYPVRRAVPPKDRANLMRRIAGAIAAHSEELARIEARNVGKPISDARGGAGMVVDG